MENKKQNCWNIVFAGDESYAAHIAVAISSLLQNNPKQQIQIYILNQDISKEAFLKIEKVVLSYTCSIVDLKIDLDFLQALVTHSHYTLACYYRLLIPLLIKEEKVLYLDSDILVEGSLQELYEKDIADYFVAAVENPEFNWHSDLQMHPKSKYFNSGVMLINLQKWRETNLTDKVISFIQENPKAIRFVDQCGLNSQINGTWLELQPKFNTQVVFFAEYFENIYFPKKDFVEAISNPVIVHFTGSSKPWHFENAHSYKAKYWEYRNKTLFKSFFEEDATLAKVISRAIPDSIKNFLKPSRKQFYS